MLEIKGIPSYSAARISTLQSAANCFSTTNNIPNIMMNDNSYRKTTAAATNNGIQQKFNNDCGNDADNLRNIVDNTISLLFKALDKNSNNKKVYYYLYYYYINLLVCLRKTLL